MDDEIKNRRKGNFVEFYADARNQPIDLIPRIPPDISQNAEVHIHLIPFYPDEVIENKDDVNALITLRVVKITGLRLNSIEITDGEMFVGVTTKFWNPIFNKIKEEIIYTILHNWEYDNNYQEFYDARWPGWPKC